MYIDSILELNTTKIVKYFHKYKFLTKISVKLLVFVFIVIFVCNVISYILKGSVFKRIQNLLVLKCV